MELKQGIRKILNLMTYEAIGASYTYMQPSFTNSYNGIRLQVKFTKHTMALESCMVRVYFRSYNPNFCIMWDLEE